MSGAIPFSIFGVITILLCLSGKPAAAQDLTAFPTDSPSALSFDDAEYTRDVASLVELTEGDKRRAKPNLRTLVRRAERDWPRLMLRYAQPAVRGLLADRQNGSNSLSIRTTLFRDNSKGLHLAGGLGRNSWGEREARLQFSARF